MRVALLLSTLLAVLAAAAPATADRPDTAAPPGASPLWLPDEEWVMERWIPFDSERLEAELRLTRHEIYRYLRRGDPTLARLARARGVAVDGLAERLLASRRADLDPARYHALLRRTERMLDQGHLAEHMLGHTFHNWSIMRQTERVYGLPEDERARLYQLRRTPAEIAGRAGVDRARFGRRILAVLREARDRGLRGRDLSRREADDLWKRQVDALDDWLDVRPVDGVRSLQAARAASAGSSLLCALPR